MIYCSELATSFEPLIYNIDLYTDIENLCYTISGSIELKSNHKQPNYLNLHYINKRINQNSFKHEENKSPLGALYISRYDEISDF